MAETDVPRHDVPRRGRSGFTVVDERQVHYLEFGAVTAPNVLCLHGGGQTAYMLQRKDVRPASLTRNLRQRDDGRWIWKHALGRRISEVEAEGEPNWRLGFEGLADDAAGLTCPALVMRGSRSDVLSDEGAEE